MSGDRYNTLPDDPDALKEIIQAQQQEYMSLQEGYTSLHQGYSSMQEKHASMQEEYNQLQQEYEYLRQKLRTLQHRFFGKKSEKLTVEDQLQMHLFNEAEDGDEDEDEKADTAVTTVRSYTRKKQGRKPIPDDLPRHRVVHDLSEEEKHCPCCGDERPCIGTEESEELDIIPARIEVNVHVRHKYGPCTCDDFVGGDHREVIQAPMPPRILPGSIVSPGLLAYVVTSKFVDGLPLYRQSKMFDRIQLDISRATLSNWVLRAAEKCETVYACMREEIRGGPLIQMDETTVRVLHEEGRLVQGTSYMWVSVGHPQYQHPLILYDYFPTRSKEVPRELLRGYTGYLQTDGYAGYNAAVKENDITHVGCLAHARRYFHDAMKVGKKSNTARKAMEYIKRLYSIEKELRSQKMAPDTFVRQRKKEALPVLDQFHGWLQEKSYYVAPKSKVGEAISYTLGEWEKLIRYLESHYLTPDNNIAENAIRPFVVGRKNWLFSNTDRGARASAIMYSLVESAKANSLEPYQYLRYLFTHLPAATSGDDIRYLLPSRLVPGDITFNKQP